MGAGKSKKQEIILVGLDGSGKTSTLKAIMEGSAEKAEVVPTIGYAQEHIKAKFGVDLIIRDFGGSKQYRDLWTTQYHTVAGIVFVVDSADADRLDEAIKEFKRILEDKTLATRKKITLLLLANKADLPQAMDVATVSEAFELNSEGRDAVHQGGSAHPTDTIGNFEYSIAPCSALKGTGIANAFMWLTERLKNGK